MCCFTVSLLLLASAAGELRDDGRVVEVHHSSDATESEQLSAALEALEEQNWLRRLDPEERDALADRLDEVTRWGTHPVEIDAKILHDRASALLAAKDAILKKRVFVNDSNRRERLLLTRALKSVGFRRVVRRRSKNADLKLSLDGTSDISNHRIFEYAWSTAQVTLYAKLANGENWVSVGKSSKKALGATRALEEARRAALHQALHALLFDLGERRLLAKVAMR